MKYLWLILILGSSAHAGIRGIGTGGGFGEMQVYALDRELPTLVKICAQQVSACGLSDAEAKLLNLYLEGLPKLPDPVLKINKSCEVPFVHQLPSGQVTIDSCMLYSSETTEFGPVPKSAKEIAEVVMNARWAELKPPGTVNVTALTQKLLWQFESNVLSNVFTAGNSAARLDIWTLMLAGHERKYLMLETTKESVDLTPKLNSMFHCPAEYWVMDKVRFTPSGPESSRAMAEVRWACAKSTFKANMAMEFTIKDGNLQTCEFQLMNRE